MTGNSTTGFGGAIFNAKNYGGTTKTRALILNSPARNNSVGSAITSDQRGFPINGTADIGAYEAATFANYNAFIWESLPATATVAQHAASFDYDGDGATNGNEFIALTNPADPASLFRILSVVRVPPNAHINVTTVLGRHYSLEFTTDLVTWLPVGGTFAGTGSPFTVASGPITGFDRLFYRARVGP